MGDPLEHHKGRKKSVSLYPLEENSNIEFIDDSQEAISNSACRVGSGSSLGDTAGASSTKYVLPETIA